MSPAESLILQEIASHANIQGMNARISYEALSASAGFSERWTKELVKRLEDRHLLRVQRRWIGPSLCAIHIYSIVRPWLRELNYAEVFRRKQERTATAHLSGAYSTRKLPPIPGESCHPFHGKAATDSMTSLPPIPRESCR
jgi:hypothetical protein